MVVQEVQKSEYVAVVEPLVEVLVQVGQNAEQVTVLKDMGRHVRSIGGGLEAVQG